jgi:hypothetical protein
MVNARDLHSTRLEGIAADSHKVQTMLAEISELMQKTNGTPYQLWMALDSKFDDRRISSIFPEELDYLGEILPEETVRFGSSMYATEKRWGIRVYDFNTVTSDFFAKLRIDLNSDVAFINVEQMHGFPTDVEGVIEVFRRYKIQGIYE